MKEIELDDQLRPLINSFQKLQETEVEMKKGFLCQICDYDNHQYLNLAQKKLFLKAHFCQAITSQYSQFLQIRAKALTPFLMLSMKLMNSFKPPFAFKLKKKALS